MATTAMTMDWTAVLELLRWAATLDPALGQQLVDWAGGLVALLCAWRLTGAISVRIERG